MVIDRRTFMSGAACMVAASAFVPDVYAQNLKRQLFAATRKDADGGYIASVFDIDGGDIAKARMPKRGHDIAVHPFRKEVVVFARRPGNFAVVLPYGKQSESYGFTGREGRHFYGHGAFSANGRLLFTTENDYENGVGVIGVRDATNRYSVVGEIPSHGVGPHDLAFLSDGKTLVVANGGIETHPDSGREILNRASMEPSLCFINTLTGELLEKHILPRSLHQLSIRHLSVGANDTVVFGCQYKGGMTHRPDLVGFCRMGRAPEFSRADTETHDSMKNYVGSVTIDRSGMIAAASSPKGGLVTFWDVATQRYLGSKMIQDGSGIAKGAGTGEFLVSSGFGELVYADSKGRVEFTRKEESISWDNHMIAL